MNQMATIGVGAVGALLSWLGVRAVRRAAERRHILDVPNERSLHSVAVPRGGGVAIVVVTLAGLGVGATLGLVPGSHDLALMLFAALLVAAVSLWDDLAGAGVALRLAGHSVAALVTIIAVGPKIALALPLLGQVRPGLVGAVIGVLWLVGLTNAFNFMDGIDGIAGLQAAAAGIGWILLAGGVAIPLWAGTLIVAGSLGFLLHNWYPARIFMGDVGSAFLGFMLAALALFASRQDPRMFLAGVLLVWPFVFDTAFTLLRRLFRGENVFEAHRSHLYQRLVLVGYSHQFVTCLYGALAAIGVFLALIWKQRIAAASWLVPSALVSAMVGLWFFVGWAERRQRARAPAGADDGEGSRAH